MKSGSDYFRESSILDIMRWLRGDGYHAMVHEPTVEGEYMEFPVEDDLDRFWDGCDVILANRMAEELHPVIGEVYYRDIFNKDRIIFVWVAGILRSVSFLSGFYAGSRWRVLDGSQEPSIH